MVQNFSREPGQVPTSTSSHYPFSHDVKVASESGLDRSKSIKSHLMRLFSPGGCNDIEGADTCHGCYGSTSALLNAAAWVGSDAWDGRFALVVATDIALYTPGSAACATGELVVVSLPDLTPYPPLPHQFFLRFKFYSPFTYPFLGRIAQMFWSGCGKVVDRVQRSARETVLRMGLVHVVPGLFPRWGLRSKHLLPTCACQSQRLMV